MEEGRGREGKARRGGSVLQSEARNPQKPMRLLMSCHTPSTPSCHAATSVALHGTTPLDNVRRWREPCYIREREHHKSYNKLWYSPHEGMAWSENTTLSLSVCHICVAFPRRRSSLMHCWNSVENIQ